MLDKLEELQQKSKGTFFEEIVTREVENYQAKMEKQHKITKINNTWIEQADELFDIYEQICSKYIKQMEPFVAKVEWLDQRVEEGKVMLEITNFKDEHFTLNCADIHTLSDYQKLEDEQFLETLDEQEEEGGIQFYYQPNQRLAEVMYGQVFQHDDPVAVLKKKVEPLLLELFQTSFDLESLLKAIATSTQEQE